MNYKYITNPPTPIPNPTTDQTDCLPTLNNPPLPDGFVGVGPGGDVLAGVAGVDEDEDVKITGVGFGAGNPVPITDAKLSHALEKNRFVTAAGVPRQDVFP